MIIIDDFSFNYNLLSDIKTKDKEKIIIFSNKINSTKNKNIKVYFCKNKQELENKILGFISSNYKDINSKLTLYSKNFKIRYHIYRFLQKRNIKLKNKPDIKYNDSFEKDIILYYDLENISGTKVVERFVSFVNENFININKIYSAYQKKGAYQQEKNILKKKICENIKCDIVMNEPNAADIKILDALKKNVKKHKDKTHILFTNDNGFIIEFSNYCMINGLNFHIFHTVSKLVSINDLNFNSHLI